MRVQRIRKWGLGELAIRSRASWRQCLGFRASELDGCELEFGSVVPEVKIN